MVSIPSTFITYNHSCTYLKIYIMPHVILIIFILLISYTGIINPGGIILLDYVSTNHDVYIFWQNAWFLFPQVFAWLVGYEWWYSWEHEMRKWSLCSYPLWKTSLV